MTVQFGSGMRLTVANLGCSKIYVVVLNWNGWRDTIECLESVLRLDYPNFCVIVCDNDSSDGSVEHIQRWAEGKEFAGCTNPALQSLTMPTVPKPIPYLHFDSPPKPGTKPCDEKLVLIRTGRNLGFAGGNNVGLRYALGCGDLDYAWLLNNDTVVRPDALSLLVERMRERPDAGICGSTLLYYHNPTKVQALGGSVYNRWFARGGHIGMLTDAGKLPSPETVEAIMKYVVGASMLVSKEFLRTIGLMNEAYFLYFEEIDWATRANGKFRLAYCPKSIVFHKDGASIGSNLQKEERSTSCVYYFSRGRLAFTREHYSYALGTVCAAVLFSAAIHGACGLWQNVGFIFRGLMAGLKRGKRESTWR